MYAHDHQLEALEEAAMAFIAENARLFQREAMPTLSMLDQRHLLLAVTGLIAAGLASALDGVASAGGGGIAGSGGPG